MYQFLIEVMKGEENMKKAVRKLYQFLIEVMKEQHFVCYSDNNTTFRECQVLFFKGRAIYLVDSAYIDAIIMEV